MPPVRWKAISCGLILGFDVGRSGGSRAAPLLSAHGLNLATEPSSGLTHPSTPFGDPSTSALTALNQHHEGSWGQDADRRAVGDIQQRLISGHEDIGETRDRPCQHQLVIGISHAHRRWIGASWDHLTTGHHRIERCQRLVAHTELVREDATNLVEDNVRENQMVLGQDEAKEVGA